jgi:hypothetical protein
LAGLDAHHDGRHLKRQASPLQRLRGRPSHLRQQGGCSGLQAGR